MLAPRLKVSLTGGIASGKSQVSRLFSLRSVNIIDADAIARDLFKINSPHLKPLRSRFGDAIFLINGELDRKALRQLVFNSKENLQWLNQFSHPLVSQEIHRQLNQATSPYVILDIPLLIDQSGKIPQHLNDITDRVLVIDIEEEKQLQRLCQRDKISVTEAQAIVSNQSSRAQKLALADDIIDNNDSIEQLAPQVNELHHFYLQLASQS